MPLNQWQV